MGFVHHEYRVEENINLIEVCVNLSVPIAIRIDVTLSVVEDTAQCEYEYPSNWGSLSLCIVKCAGRN